MRNVVSESSTMTAPTAIKTEVPSLIRSHSSVSLSNFFPAYQHYDRCMQAGTYNKRRLSLKITPLSGSHAYILDRLEQLPFGLD